MKAILVLAVIVGSALGAPTDETKSFLDETHRTKKSAYGTLSYGAPAPAQISAPCAGGAPLAPIALYLAPQASQAGPHYREDEHKEETEHARSYYGDSSAAAAAAAATAAASTSSAAAGLSLSAPSSSGPAIGVFPSGKVSNCAIPLLLSCAPNVVSGHLAASHSAGAYPAVPAYRSHEGEHLDHLHKMREMEMKDLEMSKLHKMRENMEVNNIHKMREMELDNLHKMRDIEMNKAWAESQRAAEKHDFHPDSKINEEHAIQH